MSATEIEERALFAHSLLCRHEQRHLLGQSHFKTSMGESKYTLIGIVHGQSDTSAFEFIDWKFSGLASVGR